MKPVRTSPGQMLLNTCCSFGVPVVRRAPPHLRHWPFLPDLRARARAVSRLWASARGRRRSNESPAAVVRLAVVGGRPAAMSYTVFCTVAIRSVARPADTAPVVSGVVEVDLVRTLPTSVLDTMIQL